MTALRKMVTDRGQKVTAMTASICHKGVNIKNYSYRVKKMTAIVTAKVS